ncbi:hypothetical protein [Enterobacter roggenkampii]|uniref:hypothetical protein n=1 Tax=Enterobacter roggenkampii TaxID=1812935 RepID=UPI002DB5FB6E|nr:hypothetical protein [Enterobacter roggenkampii]MEB6619607.1 hypothetical protein [Enterobacter roggenkampii]
MNEAFKGILTALEGLEKQFKDVSKGEDLLNTAFNFAYPAMYPIDFLDVIIITKAKIKKYGDIELSDDEVEELTFMPIRVNSLASLTVPQMFNGNGNQAIPAFLNTFNYINFYLDHIFSYERLDKSNLIPNTMSRKIKSLDARLGEIVPAIDELDNKIKVINDAHTAAENIPIDLQELKKYNEDAFSYNEKIQKVYYSLDGMETKGIEQLESLSQKDIKAKEYLELCEKAIVASTSKGLAGAFEIKARNLNWTILAWVVGLLVALSAGGWIGYKRLEVLSSVLEKANPSTAVIATQLMLSLFSVAAPLWFAWMSTKQINQRFKLAEDYAFKSAVAKAYEGYKNEAARVSDGDFEKRLFDSALTRLEEAPLRLIKEDDHGTPWAEMLNSKSFQNFLDASIENVDFVKGLLNKKGKNVNSASNDDVISVEKTKVDA